LRYKLLQRYFLVKNAKNGLNWREFYTKKNWKSRTILTYSLNFFNLKINKNLKIKQKIQKNLHINQMSRQSNSSNPYKEPSTFYETFSKDAFPDKNLQTAQFHTSEPDKTQGQIVLMAAEFERLHGIIQALVLRYKDLEEKFVIKEKEIVDIKGKNKGNGENLGKINGELDHAKKQISELILEVEELKGKLSEKEAEIAGIKAKGTLFNPPISSYTVKTEGGYPLYAGKFFVLFNSSIFLDFFKI